MTVYLINSPVLTSYGDWRFQPLTSLCQARDLLRGGFVSAIGHAASAALLSHLLDIDIPVNRISVTMQTGDQALILRILKRLPEGVVLTEQELHATPYELALLTLCKTPPIA